MLIPRNIILTVLSLLAGLAANAAEMTLVVTPRPPVVATEVRLSVAEKIAADLPATVKITAPDGTVREEKVHLSDNKPFLVWKPEHTGFYRIELTGEGISARLDAVPVVWRRQYFYGWVVPEQADKLAAYPLLGSCAVVIGKPERYGEYRRYGSTVLGYVSHRTTSISLEMDRQAAVAKLVEQWRKPLDHGADGIWLDEIGAYPDSESLQRVAIQGEALAAIRKLFPDRILMVLAAGSLLREQITMCKKAGAVIGSEIYIDCLTAFFGTHGFKKYLDTRIEALRAGDMLFERKTGNGTTAEQIKPGGGMIVLGLNNCFGTLEEPVAARLEHYVRYVKKNAPEAPGLAFWGSGRDRAYIEQHLPYALQEKLFERYYINPVLDLREIFLSDYAPGAAKPVTVSVEVHNLGGMALTREYTLDCFLIGSDGRKIKVASAVRNGIGVGFATLKCAGDTPVEPVELDGNHYLVANPALTGGTAKEALLARQTVNFEITVPQSGWYTVLVELRAPDGVTVLDGTISLMMNVR